MLYFDFTELQPDDNYFFNNFSSDCIACGADGSVFINWGSSFPWTIDNRLSLFDHLHEKTITAFNRKNNPLILNIVPVIPFLGGMDFILSFPSFCNLRFAGNCCAINPEAAGTSSLLNEIADDYLSLMSENTAAAAFNMSMAVLLDNIHLQKESARQIAAVLENNSTIETIYLLGLKKDRQILQGVLENININNFSSKEVFFIENTGFGAGAADNGKNNKEVIVQTPLFYLPENSKRLMIDYNSDLKKAWEIVRLLKTEIYRIKYSSGVSHHNASVLSCSQILLVDYFSKIMKTSDIIKKMLAGRLNMKSVDRYFDSAAGIIKKEIMLIDFDMENIDLRLKGG